MMWGLKASFKTPLAQRAIITPETGGVKRFGTGILRISWSGHIPGESHQGSYIAHTKFVYFLHNSHTSLIRTRTGTTFMRAIKVDAVVACTTIPKIGHADPHMAAIGVVVDGSAIGVRATPHYHIAKQRRRREASFCQAFRTYKQSSAPARALESNSSREEQARASRAAMGTAFWGVLQNRATAWGLVTHFKQNANHPQSHLHDFRKRFHS